MAMFEQRVSAITVHMYQQAVVLLTALLGIGVLCLLTTAPIWLLFGRELKYSQELW